MLWIYYEVVTGRKHAHYPTMFITIAGSFPPWFGGVDVALLEFEYNKSACNWVRTRFMTLFQDSPDQLVITAEVDRSQLLLYVWLLVVFIYCESLCLPCLKWASQIYCLPHSMLTLALKPSLFSHCHRCMRHDCTFSTCFVATQHSDCSLYHWPFLLFHATASSFSYLYCIESKCH